MNITFKLFGHVITIKPKDNILICPKCNHQLLHHTDLGCTICNCNIKESEFFIYYG